MHILQYIIYSNPDAAHAPDLRIPHGDSNQLDPPPAMQEADDAVEVERPPDTEDEVEPDGYGFGV